LFGLFLRIQFVRRATVICEGGVSFLNVLVRSGYLMQYSRLLSMCHR